MKKNYRVSLPVNIGGVTYEYGAQVELDAETALHYRHALVIAPAPAAPTPEEKRAADTQKLAADSAAVAADVAAIQADK